MPKEYKKLTGNQFRQLVDLLPVMQAQQQEMLSDLAATSEERWTELLKGDYNWGWCYELPFTSHIAISFVALGLGEYLKETASQPDPQQVILDDAHKDLIESHHPEFEIQDILGLVMSLGKTINSICLYGRSLSALVEEVREKGDLESLFNAVRVDRTVLNCPTVADCIAKAELRSDQAFFTKLQLALKGPSKKQMASLAGMKFSFATLKELEINDLSDIQLEKLMVETLEVYAKVGSAPKNLRAHYQHFRKFKTI